MVVEEKEKDGNRDKQLPKNRLVLSSSQTAGWCGGVGGANLTYVLVADTAWHDPLISEVQGSKATICPRAKVQRGPRRAAEPPSGGGGEDQKVTFQLSASDSGARFIPIGARSCATFRKKS